MSRSKKVKVVLDGSEHRDVQLEIFPRDAHTDGYGRSVTLSFLHDGMDLHLFMMEKDARTLAEFLLKNTKDWENV